MKTTIQVPEPERRLNGNVDNKKSALTYTPEKLPHELAEQRKGLVKVENYNASRLLICAEMRMFAETCLETP